MTLYRDMAQRLLSRAGGETDRLLDTRAPRGLGASRYMPLAALRCSTNTRAYPHSRREVVPYSPQTRRAGRGTDVAGRGGAACWKSWGNQGRHQRGQGVEGDTLHLGKHFVVLVSQQLAEMIGLDEPLVCVGGVGLTGSALF